MLVYYWSKNETFTCNNFSVIAINNPFLEVKKF